ncbi:hypothetical protein GYMLUDRAFT_253380 [Collybiopsis luxurians FD-317 M1]|uniref:Unplaced genomic scaffold GYMLUscaffold_197, whole genome shotgun sequence n=1 Tax=Collybiopsis luxurians FD-317 M1 TaxID=944289 RepID=A0A0D0B7G7_9AGAR|nr:hypothetical protein GYMLUDRAFT_253380 [Collybiopsis luxurians FD-317 M1]
MSCLGSPGVIQERNRQQDALALFAPAAWTRLLGSRSSSLVVDEDVVESYCVLAAGTFNCCPFQVSNDVDISRWEKFLRQKVYSVDVARSIYRSLNLLLRQTAKSNESLECNIVKACQSIPRIRSTNRLGWFDFKIAKSSSKLEPTFRHKFAPECRRNPRSSDGGI